MNNNTKFAVIGGDLRQVKLAGMLASDGNTVNAIGFESIGEIDKDITLCKELSTAVKDADCVILGLPYSNDGINANAPLSKKPIVLKELYDLLSHGQLVVGGKLNDSAYLAAGRHGFKLVDYLEREELAVLNAIPTAEGAIQIAMEELPITIHNSKCLVIGYGRIGKVLSHNLCGLGAKVTVSARKHSDFAWIKANGYNAANTSELNKTLSEKYDVIFNTVPTLVFDSELLDKISKECLIIDLASKPGGVDLNAASERGLKVIWALSLPGKVAPITSGEIIKSTILNIITEEVP